mmetsp:Transcript_11975/g.27708  ORF Transcript_11975/g.27708 Transcript_11975/m.27708 type:complete len:104 (+) Transcript_11975:2-313(+)
MAAKFRWEMYETFNDFVVRYLDARSKRQRHEPNPSGVHMEVLDVHPMTILRQDGHVGLDSNVEGVPDCLHYSLPGPVDFWNHLMYSNLKDLAVATTPNNGLQP